MKFPYGYMIVTGVFLGHFGDVKRIFDDFRASKMEFPYRFRIETWMFLGYFWDVKGSF